ncbi:hypothetical protein HYH02_008455 [Chlamydomonas schloesseri]|uniref:Uncharacterized protein n=1 Tax=Chlamydomonas schloesseri TaxID=2026947 RepID=A0A835WFL9_9CHLO|nr:hypothetical protein HYH02_008455 [Chlamydomonas schloesseri]|eukprot:KAG2446463.1 hypothetical protein HYH02_008455 [Chlamydomonas schloesseri]
MTTDYCDIKAALAAGNWTEALAIYSNGKNSRTGLSFRSFSRFASYVASGPEFLHDSLAMGRNSSWLDIAIRAAFGAQNRPLVEGLIVIAGFKYGLHEVDEGATKIVQYLEDNTLTNLVADSNGAAHSVDEGWVMWSGGRDGGCGYASSWAAALGADMGTTFLGKSYVNAAVINTFNDLLMSSRKDNGTLSSAAYNASRVDLMRQLVLLGLQGVLHSSYKAHAATACRRPAADLAEAKAYITVHWTYLEPFLVARGVPADRINRLRSALTATRTDYMNVRRAVVSVADAMGRRMFEIGTPIHDRVTRGWEGCSASRLL